MDDLFNLEIKDKNKNNKIIKIQGISICWLYNFFNKYKNMTTRDIVNKIIIPITFNNKKCFIDLIPEQYKGKPEFFVSHAWDDIFYYGIDNLIIKPFNMFLWIDIFCINQHLNDIDIKNILTQVLENVNSLLIKGESNIIYERLWFLYEISQAKKCNIKIELLIENIEFKYRKNINEIIINKIENAKCTKKIDEHEIKKLIIEQFGNYKNFSTFLKDNINLYSIPSGTKSCINLPGQLKEIKNIEKNKQIIDIYELIS